MNPFCSMLRGLLPALLCAGALAQAPADCPPTAQVPTTEQVQAGGRNALDHGFLWRISKGGHSSWLFGTLHAAKFEWMFPGPRVSGALTASDTIALELDLLHPDIRQRMAQGMATRPAIQVPEPLQRRARRLAEAACVSPEALAAIGPEFQIAALTALAGQREGLEAAFGIDTFLSSWGSGQNKVVVSLETPELQLKALQWRSAAETIEFMTSALDDLESGQAGPIARRIGQVWADGDLDTLMRYESWCDCVKTAADRSAMARLLDDRNPAMADGIAAMHTGGRRVFAAVGSLHMIGPQGLPALMAKRGFEVERIIYAR